MKRKAFDFIKKNVQIIKKEMVRIGIIGGTLWHTFLYTLKGLF